MSFGSFTSSWLVWSDSGTPSPVLAVAFDEGSGNTFTPTIGPGTGTITPGYGQWIPGPNNGTALGRYGTGPGGYDNDPCALLTGLSALNTASWSGMTVMAWVKLHDDQTTERWPLLLLNGPTTDDGWMGWQASYHSDKPTSWVNGVPAQSADDVAPAGVWAHFCTIWDGTSQYFYVNGIQVASTAVGGPLYNTTAIAIGSSIYNYGAEGVDDLRIYDRALDSAHIASLMTVAV